MKKKNKVQRNLTYMFKTHSLSYIIKYFSIIPFVIILLVLLFTDGIITDYTCELFNLTERGAINSMLYKLMRLAVPVGLYALYTFIVFTSLRSKYYAYITDGRNYDKDHGLYEKTFTEMTQFYKEAEPHRKYTDEYPITNWRNCKGINFGYDPEGRAIFLKEDCEYNICVFGPPGSSKTAGFANVNAITFPGSCLIVDIKGDIYNYVKNIAKSKRKIARFCPDDPNAMNVSAHFDPLQGINKLSVTDRKLRIENIAIALIPDDGGKEGNYFPETARIYFQGVTHLLLHENPNVTFPEIVHAILQGNYAEWVFKTEASDCIEAKELLLSLKSNSEKNVSGAYQNLTKRLNVYSNPVLDELLSYKKGKMISVDMLDKGYDLYLQISEEHLTALGPLLSMIINTFSTEFLRRPDTSSGAKNRFILMMLDELSSLHLSYDLLNTVLSKARSKSILTAIITQNLPQLKRLYGQDGAESLLGNCHVQAVLGANDPSTAEYFSRKLGMKKDYKVTDTISNGTNSTKTYGKSVTIDDKVPVYRPEDVADLKSESQNILYIDGKYTFLRKLNCYKD